MERMAILPSPSPERAPAGTRPSSCEDVAHRLGAGAWAVSFQVTDPVLDRVKPRRELFELVGETIRQMVDGVRQFCGSRGQFLACRRDLPYGIGVLYAELVIQPAELRGL